MASMLRVLDYKLPLTDNCHHYDEINEVPWEIQKCVFTMPLLISFIFTDTDNMDCSPSQILASAILDL